jgi:hypothetical protein
MLGIQTKQEIEELLKVPYDVLLSIKKHRCDKRDAVIKTQYQYAAQARDKENKIFNQYPILKKFESEIIKIDSFVRDIKLREVLKP